MTGDVSPDGSTILLRVETEHDGLVDLSFPTVDLQHLVMLLLILGGKAAVNGRFAAFSETFQAQPLPLHGGSLGVEENDRGVLTVEVGAAILLFSLPRSSMMEMGAHDPRPDPDAGRQLGDKPASQLIEEAAHAWSLAQQISFVASRVWVAIPAAARVLR